MNEQIRALAHQAINENVADSTAREICKWVMECELHGFETIHPSNAYLAEHFGWGDETVRVAISKAKKSGFIATTGSKANRTFELNTQFLKGKMAEIQAKRPLKKALDFSDLLLGNDELPNNLPNNLPNILPNNLPNNLPQNNRGDSDSNSNSNENRNRARVAFFRVNPSGRAWKSQKIYTTAEEIEKLESTNPDSNIDFKYWKSPKFVGDEDRAKFKYMKAKLIIPDVVEEEEDPEEYKMVNGYKCKKVSYKGESGEVIEGWMRVNNIGGECY